MEALVVLCTVPKGKGKEIARKIIDSKLGACVNVVHGLLSIYWWKGEVVEDEEELLIIKTLASKYDELESFIKSIHPYTVPEIIALNVSRGNGDYISWIEQSIT